MHGHMRDTLSKGHTCAIDGCNAKAYFKTVGILALEWQFTGCFKTGARPVANMARPLTLFAMCNVPGVYRRGRPAAARAGSQGAPPLRTSTAASAGGSEIRVLLRRAAPMPCTSLWPREQWQQPPRA